MTGLSAFWYYLIFERVMSVLVDFHQQGHFVMTVIKSVHVISNQTWTHKASKRLLKILCFHI